MRATWNVDYAQSERYEELLKLLPNRAESEINKYLQDEGIEKARREMENLTPISDRPITKSHGRHAKPSKPYGRQEFPNLGFTVITSPQFNYLVFPDEGMGTSKGRVAQEFSRLGAEKASNDIVKGINAALEELLNKGG